MSEHSFRDTAGTTWEIPPLDIPTAMEVERQTGVELLSACHEVFGARLHDLLENARDQINVAAVMLAAKIKERNLTPDDFLLRISQPEVIQSLLFAVMKRIVDFTNPVRRATYLETIRQRESQLSRGAASVTESSNRVASSESPPVN